MIGEGGLIHHLAGTGVDVCVAGLGRAKGGDVEGGVGRESFGETHTDGVAGVEVAAELQPEPAHMVYSHIHQE